LLHGGGLDRAALSWRHFLPELAQSHDVIATNWPGYGGSAGFGRAYTIPDLGRWLVDLMDRLDVARADLVGVSMGGGAALWMAVHHPERVRRLVPVSAYGLAARAQWHLTSWAAVNLLLTKVTFAMLARYPGLLKPSLRSIFADPARLTDEVVADVRAALDSLTDQSAFVGFQRGELTPRRLRTVFGPDALATIGAPTLLVHGQADGLVPVQAARMARGHIPGARLEVLDTGHWPMREAPETFNPLVAEFLRAG
jgi:pimeloyl-ACP methyl ester carboxylesterase